MKVFLVFLALAAVCTCRPYYLSVDIIPRDSNSVTDFLKGLLEGLNETGNINELLKCAKDLEAVINDIMSALELIRQGGITNILAGVTKLVQDVLKLLEILQPCSQGFTQLEKLFEALKNVNFMKIAMKIVFNFSSFLSLIVDCISSFKNGNLYQAGKDLGALLLKLFLSDAVEFNYEDVIKLIEGFLEGINQGHNFEDIEECIKDVPIIIEDVKMAIELLKNVDWKNLDKIIDALMKVFDVFKAILIAVKPCSKSPNDIEFLINRISNLDVNKLLTKIMSNIFQLVHDITEAINKVAQHLYFDCGKDLGDIFYRLILVD